ncbi:MAG: PEGA domain-containing protein [Myxococcales bacterium]|nr:PEGA domain-containing protein [Myxococcales bacterium]
MSIGRGLASLLVLATIIASAPARADDGDAVEGSRPEVAVTVVVTAADGVKLGAARKATVAVSMERALRRDRRLLVVDQDDRLAARSNAIPDDAVAEARALLSTGEEMLRRGQAKAAVLKLQGASTQLASVLAWTQKQDLARAQLFLGSAQAVAGEPKAAIATFVALLAWRPEQLPDPDIEPTTVLPLWEKAQAQAKKLPLGSIDIATSPPGALAYVDGKMVGFTPTTVDGLTEGVHYVTMRRGGSTRRVEPVRISARTPASLAAVLEPSNGATDLAEATELLDSGVGEPIARAQAQAGLATMGDLLAVEHVVVVDVQAGEGQYRGYVYAIDGGARLGVTDIKVGERELEEAFAVAGADLYKQVATAKVAAKPKKARRPGKKGPSIFTRWWFWTGVGAVVAAGIAVPVVMELTDGPAPVTCPSGQSCGTVLYRF